MDKNSLRPIEAAQEATERVTSAARGKLLSWLPRHTCDCGAICEADTQFVEEQAMPVAVWQCTDDECDRRYYRDEDNPVTADMW